MKHYYAIPFFLLAVFSLEAQIIHIPSDQPTIQAGIDVANNGDTLLVAEGTYFENINFLGKPVTVASEFLMDGDTSHISRTIIDGSQSENPDTSSTVIMVSGEDTTSVLMGFTIQGGRGTNFVPRQDSYVRKGGGGIYMFKSGGLIYRNVIKDNRLDAPNNSYFFGGGICVCLELDHTAIIRDNWIHHNTINAATNAGNGGGVAMVGGRIICEGNEITDNEISAGGWADGGGIFWLVKTIEETIEEGVIRNNIISNNTANSMISEGGGGGYFQEGGTYGKNIELKEVYNNVISNNFARSGGGIVTFYTCGCIFNNTIVDNSSEDKTYGSASHVAIAEPKGVMLLCNNIIYSSEDPTLPDIWLWNTAATSTYIINNIIGNQTAMQAGVTAKDNWNEEPEFVTGSYVLTENSPGIDWGLDSIEARGNWYYAPKIDFHGNPRPDRMENLVDLGAFELTNTTGIFNRSIKFKEELFKIYPNPVLDVLNIETYFSGTHHVSMQSLNGQSIFQTRIEGTSGQIDLSSVRKGIYFISIRTKDFVTTRKIIKM